VQIHATEHFCAGFKPWSCSAVVVRDPAYGEILGVLDVSGLSSRFHRNWLALAMMTAGRIEAELATRQMESRWRLAEAGLQSLSRASSSAETSPARVFWTPALSFSRRVGSCSTEPKRVWIILNSF